MRAYRATDSSIDEDRNEEQKRRTETYNTNEHRNGDKSGNGIQTYVGAP